MEEIALMLIIVGALVLLSFPVLVFSRISRFQRDQEAGFNDIHRALRVIRHDIDSWRGSSVNTPAKTSVVDLSREQAVHDRPDVETTSEPPSVAPRPQTTQAEEPREPVPGTYPPLAPSTTPSQTPREPSRFEAAARETLQKVWNWIVVGEEHVPTGVSFEYAFASQWLLRIGILILVVGIGFFLKYSVEHGLINEVGRVAISSLAGVGLMVSGTRLLGRRYHVLGQGLLGGGLATLYFAVYAAANFYQLIEVPLAFGLMTALTVLAGAIAVRFNSILVAVLGIIGGYGTPVMLSTDVVNFLGLYGYILVLGIGVLGICYWKNWPLVNYLSFAGTYALFFSAMPSYSSSYFWEVMPFVAAYFVLFSTMTFLYKLANQSKSNLLDVVALWVNAGVFFSVSYTLIAEMYGSDWVAVATLAATAFYVAHVFYFLSRRVVDRELLVSFIGLAAFFLAVTMPLLLSTHWITVSWAIQAFILLWVAGKIGSEFLRQICYLLYAIVLFRFGAIDLQQHFLQAPTTVGLSLYEYLGQLAERIVIFGIPIASIGGAYRLLMQQESARGRLVDPGNDVQGWLNHSWARRLAVGVSLSMSFVYLHFEFAQSMGYLYEPMKLPLLTLLWVAMCGLLLHEVIVRESRTMQVLLLTFVSGLLIKFFVFDLPSWDLTTHLVYGPQYSFRDAIMRLIDFGALIGFLAGGYALLAGRSHAASVGKVFGFGAIATLFIYLTLEVNSFLFVYVEGLRPGGISILWSLFALGLILPGIAKNIRALRYLGLALFGVVTWKVFFIDLSQLEQFYRIVAFILLGVLVLSGSFLYLRYRETFAIEQSTDKEKVA